MEVYGITTAIPVRPGLVNPTLDFLEKRGYEASADKVEAYRFHLYVDKEPDKETLEVIAKTPHFTSFVKGEEKKDSH